MAEVERRSKPRKVETPEDEENQGKGHGIVLLGYLFGGIAILVGMVIIAGFLSNNPLGNNVYYGFGALLVLAAALFLTGKMMSRKTA